MRLRKFLWRALAGVIVAGIAGVAVLVLGRARGWVEPDAPGGPPTVRLISADQYLAAIRDVFGEDIVVAADFPALQRREGLLALGASAVALTPGALDQFERAARRIAEQVVDEVHRPMLVSCAPAAPEKPDAACAGEFFARVGRFLFRRPLDELQMQTYVGAAGMVTERLGDFYKGLAYSLAGMLTAPQFLYFTEHTEPDPQHPGERRLDAYAKAARLSLFLWNVPPDDQLLAAAQSGALHEAQGLRREVERLLDSPRLEHGVRAFFSDLLAFDKFDTLSKDPVIYPAFTRGVARGAKEQTLRLIVDHLLVRQGDYRDLFTTPRTFVDLWLGPLYDKPVPNPQEWVPHELDARQSAGLLTTLSFLTLHSHPGRTSPTLRGKAFRELLLCQKVPDPPPNVNFEIFEDPNRRFKNARDRLTAHSTDPVCAGCHKLTDPIGLALENFDGDGKFRLTENQSPIDSSGILDGQAFNDVAGLGKAMRDHPGLPSCLTHRWYSYAIGRQMEKADKPWLTYITRRFAAHGYRVPELLREIATSRAFYAVSERGRDGEGRTLLTSTATHVHRDWARWDRGLITRSEEFP